VGQVRVPEAVDPVVAADLVAEAEPGLLAAVVTEGAEVSARGEERVRAEQAEREVAQDRSPGSG